MKEVTLKIIAQKGQDGRDADEQKIIDSVLSRITIPEDGKTPTEEEILSLIKPLIPIVKDGETPEVDYNQIVSDVLSKIPKQEESEVDVVTKILSSPLKLKFTDLEGIPDVKKIEEQIDINTFNIQKIASKSVSLKELDDTSVSKVSDGQSIRWNATTNKWENYTLSPAVTPASPSDSIQYNNSGVFGGSVKARLTSTGIATLQKVIFDHVDTPDNGGSIYSVSGGFLIDGPVGNNASFIQLTPAPGDVNTLTFGIDQQFIQVQDIGTGNDIGFWRGSALGLGSAVGLGTDGSAQFAHNAVQILANGNTILNGNVTSSTGFGIEQFGANASAGAAGTVFGAGASGGINSVVVGNDGYVNGDNGVAIGRSTRAISESILIGNNTTTLGGGSIVIGYQGYAGNDNVIVFTNSDSAHGTLNNNGGYNQLYIYAGLAHFQGNSLQGLSFIKTGGTSSQFLKADGSVDSSTYGTGDMVLASAQTNSGIKTFLNTTMKLRNVANTFDGYFLNTNTANRVYTLKDATGTLAFTTDITGINSGTNTGDQTITLTSDVTGSGTGSFATTIANNAVTNTKAAQMTTKTYKGRTTAGTGNPEDVSVATLKTDLVLVKADVGLGNVDNTSDANKPVSTAQQTALNLKADIASPTFTGTVSGITAAMVGAPAGSGNSTGTNTGDQTSIVGITGTLAQFNTAITDADITPTSRNINTTAPLSGGGDMSADRTLTTSMATNKLIGRGTAGTGVMEEITLGTNLSLTGTTLNAVAGSLTLTTVEVNLGTTPKDSGSFVITTSGLTSGKSVIINKANGPYTGKGTLADEAEMDGIIVTGATTSTTTIQCYWNSFTLALGNIKFNYAVSA